MAEDDTPKVVAPEPTSSLEGAAVLVAVRSHFVASRDRAIANLNHYIFNPAGVGEHPDVVAECISLISDIDHAESALHTLARITQ